MHFEKIPVFTIYDDACHLKKYIENLKSFNENKLRCTFFKSTKLVVDKFHIHNHVDELYCLKFCDPNKYSELDEINTVTCEETNIWLSPYKHSVKHMNKQRYLFFLFIMFDYYNQIILSINA